MNTILQRYGTVLRCFDNGGKSADRYTIVPPRWAGAEYREGSYWLCISANREPFHPQGIGMSGSCTPGPHLGKRVTWQDLPADVQRFARKCFPEFAPNIIANIHAKWV